MGQVKSRNINYTLNIFAEPLRILQEYNGGEMNTFSAFVSHQDRYVLQVNIFILIFITPTNREDHTNLFKDLYIFFHLTYSHFCSYCLVNSVSPS